MYLLSGCAISFPEVARGRTLFLVLAHPHVVAAHAVGDEHPGQQGDQQHQALFLLHHLEPGVLVCQHLLLFQGDAQEADGLLAIPDLLHELDPSFALLRQ